MATYFCGEHFEEVLPDPEGDIPMTIELRPPQGVLVRAGLRKGSHYIPGMHPFPVTITVAKGAGQFLLHDRVQPYQAGASFIVPAHTAHAFIRVDEDTIFIKDASDVCRC